jgi:tetratricopeptide (TPR) repeat protein
MKPRLEDSSAKNVFISRAGADADFAAVIGSMLEAAGYKVTLQQWDFANRNFMERMHASLAGGARVVALLSPEYLRSDHCQAEWQNAIADDPLNTKSRLIVLRVAECEPMGLLRGLAYWDLVPIRDNRPLLDQTVRDAVRQDRDREAAIGPYWREARTIIDAEAIRPVPSFSGREEELAAISAVFANDGTTAVVHGLGGIGKSSVAREYAWRNRDQYAVIWWLNAQTEDRIIEGLLRLGSLFTRGLDQLKDRRSAAQQVTSSILSGFAKPILLLFDNLEDERLLRAWQPRTGSRALVTSRNATWSADVSAIALAAWPVETAVGYLQRESGRTDLTNADGTTIAEVLGSFPLALSHAAASLRGMRMVTPQKYMAHIGEHLSNAPRGTEYPSSVFATFSTSIAQAEHQAAGSAALLCFAAQFAPDTIPDELFRQPIDAYSHGLQPVVHESGALDLHSALADGLRLDEALGTLDHLSLLAFSPSSRTYSMHRLVQLAGRDLVRGALRTWSECAVGVAYTAFPEVEFETWAQCERLLPHARAALEALPADEASPTAGRLAHRCAAYLRERGEYAAGELLQTHAVAIRKRAFGSDHVEVAIALHGLARLYSHQGRYGEAESLYKRALVIQERAHGKDHADVADTLNNLGNLYGDEGRYEEAEPLYKRALTFWEAALGLSHSRVAVGLNNLARLYFWQGRYDDAERLYERALAIRQKALPPDHPDLASSLNNLALLYREQKRYEEAESRYTRALSIWETALGPQHPYVAACLHNLAELYYRQGRYDDAEPLELRSLMIKERAFGSEHPDVAFALNGLALLYSARGQYALAEPLHERALTIREKALGPNHPDVATALSDFAASRSAQGRDEDAEELYARALAISEKALGPDHPQTKETRERLHILRSK